MNEENREDSEIISLDQTAVLESDKDRELVLYFREAGRELEDGSGEARKALCERTSACARE